MSKAIEVVSGFLNDSDQWSASLCGTEAIRSLETKFTGLVGHSFAVAVCNATCGLYAAFNALEIQDSDVVTTPFTWAGSLVGLLMTGNRPVFADIDPHTLTLDPASVVKSITPKTRAILAVDVYGFPCKGNELQAIADKFNLRIIQDCAQSFGSYVRGHHSGWWADASVFSFGPGKPLFAGEGGIVTFRNRIPYERMIAATQHPLRQMRDLPGIIPNEFFLNIRINPLAAVWADTMFDEALLSVEGHRKRCLDILKVMAERELIRQPLIEFDIAQPSFHVLSVEPLCRPAKLQKALDDIDPNYCVELLPIRKLLHKHAFFRRLAAERKWPQSERCQIAEYQCRNRLRIQIKQGFGKLEESAAYKRDQKR